jgi:hypothetical protein
LAIEEIDSTCGYIFVVHLISALARPGLFHGLANIAYASSTGKIRTVVADRPLGVSMKLVGPD